jgi:FKBP-type peptidyl-prolyl cis-trans isomerase
MKITGTGVAVGAAVVIALGFLFFGPSVLTPFKTLPSTNTSATMNDQTGAADAAAGTAGSGAAAPIPAPTTLQVNDLKVGTGLAAAAGDTVTVNYVGALTDGTVFDASKNHGQPFSFKLGVGQVIPGWDQGLIGMKEGGQRVLVIPASMAYGAQAVGAIPPNSTLIFEVELVKVQKGAQ